MTTIPFEVRNRWTGEVQFTAQIECAETALPSIKLGLAVRWARKSGAVLRGADLSGAVLRDAVLRGADLSGAVLRDAVLRGADLSGAVLRDAVLRGAVLSDADLRGAVLRGAVLSDAVLSDAVLRGAVLRDADLRSYKADLWMILASAQAEIPGLIATLREGRVNGSTYHGACACLVGTIANVRGVPVDALERDGSRPAEQWFLMIKAGDKPGDDTGGGFAAKTALDWTLEYCRLHGIEAGEPITAQAEA